MKLSSFSPLMITLMTDEMDIYRYTESTNSDSTTSTNLPTTPLHTNVKCRLSFNAIDSPKDSEVDQNPIKYSPKIFCPQSTDLKAGDEIVVRRLQDDGSIMLTYKGQVGTPANYPTHKEVLFFIKESA